MAARYPGPVKRSLFDWGCSWEFWTWQVWASWVGLQLGDSYSDCSRGVPFSTGAKKTTGLVGLWKHHEKKVFQVVSSIFHYLSFLFFWWVEIWSWWVDWVDEKMFFLGRIHNCFLLEISGSLVGLVVCFPGIALTTFPEFPRNSAHNIPWIQRLVVFSNIFFCHPEIWGWNDPIWRAYFSNGLVQPTTRFRDLKSRMPRFFMFPFFPDLKKKNSSKVLEISLKNFSVKGLWFGSHECFCELLSRPTSTMFFNTPLRRCLTNCLDAPNSSKLFGCQQRSQVLKGTWNLSSFYFWFQDDFTLRLGLRWRRQGGKLIHYGFSPSFPVSAIGSPNVSCKRQPKTPVESCRWKVSSFHCLMFYVKLAELVVFPHDAHHNSIFNGVEYAHILSSDWLTDTTMRVSLELAVYPPRYHISRCHHPCGLSKEGFISFPDSPDHVFLLGLGSNCEVEIHCWCWVRSVVRIFFGRPKCSKLM